MWSLVVMAGSWVMRRRFGFVRTRGCVVEVSLYSKVSSESDLGEGTCSCSEIHFFVKGTVTNDMDFTSP